MKESTGWACVVATIAVSTILFLVWFNPSEVVVSNLSDDQKEVLIHFLDKEDRYRVSGSYLGITIRQRRELICSGYLGGNSTYGYALSIKGRKAASTIQDEEILHKKLLVEYGR